MVTIFLRWPQPAYAALHLCRARSAWAQSRCPAGARGGAGGPAGARRQREGRGVKDDVCEYMEWRGP
jgi:hypothetical protein